MRSNHTQTNNNAKIYICSNNHVQFELGMEEIALIKHNVDMFFFLLIQVMVHLIKSGVVTDEDIEHISEQFRVRVLIDSFSALIL